MNTLNNKPAKQKVAQGHLLLEQPLRLEDIPRRSAVAHRPEKGMGRKVGEFAGVIMISVVFLFLAYVLVCLAIALWRWTV
jgi:hypothetical protein